jgi:hypothetical protein
MMKRKLVVGLAVAAVAVPCAMAVNQIDIGYPGSGYGPYVTGQGGEFTFTAIGGWLDTSLYSADPNTKTKNVGVDGTFQTFCIEGGETIQPYNTTTAPPPYNAVLNNNAVYGGVGAAGDPISVGTGWLYSQFARASWQNGLSYDYTNPGRSGDTSSSAHKLQQAIWWLESENGVVYDPNNIYMAGVVSKFGTELLAKANGGWNYGVKALNLTIPGTGARAQDGLFYVPDGGMTMAMFGMGLAGLGLFARRRD